jgi:hypothetical protein
MVEVVSMLRSPLVATMRPAVNNNVSPGIKKARITAVSR